MVLQGSCPANRHENVVLTSGRGYFPSAPFRTQNETSFALIFPAPLVFRMARPAFGVKIATLRLCIFHAKLGAERLHSARKMKPVSRWFSRQLFCRGIFDRSMKKIDAMVPHERWNPWWTRRWKAGDKLVKKIDAEILEFLVGLFSKMLSFFVTTFSPCPLFFIFVQITITWMELFLIQNNKIKNI